MPKVGVNNEPLLERLVFAYDGTDYRVVACDTDGNLVAAVLADQNVQARGYGWFAANWRKQPLRPGFSDTFAGSVVKTPATAGENTLTSDPVPAGEYWILQSVGGRNSLSACQEIVFYCIVDGIGVFRGNLLLPAAGQFLITFGEMLLGPGDTILGYFKNCAAGDYLYFNYGGMRIDVDQ